MSLIFTSDEIEVCETATVRLQNNATDVVIEKVIKVEELETFVKISTGLEVYLFKKSEIIDIKLTSCPF